MKIILGILLILFLYLVIFALAYAQNRMHRMEERWMQEGTAPFSEEEYYGSNS